MKYRFFSKKIYFFVSQIELLRHVLLEKEITRKSIN